MSFLDLVYHIFEFRDRSNIHNRLELSGIQLTVLLVGTEDILATKSMLIQTHKQQIIGRFMIKVHRFNSVRNIQDLQICLAINDYRSILLIPVGIIPDTCHLLSKGLK